MKQCNKCGKLKLIKKFEKRNRAKDGYRNQCRECRYKQSRNKFTCICEYCGKRFPTHNKNARFCSNKCSSKIKEKQIYYKCAYCGKESHCNQYNYQRSENHFCSKNCEGNWKSKNIKGKIHPRWNDNLTQQEREYGRTGIGISQWRKEVYERDNYTCQISGLKISGTLEAHHLYNYADNKDLRTDINNGITLHKEIHKLFHKLYGYKHTTKEQFEEFRKNYNKGKYNNMLPNEIIKFKSNKESA